MANKRKFISTIIVPQEFNEPRLVEAINKAIQQVASYHNIELGSSLDWSVVVREDYKHLDEL